MKKSDVEKFLSMCQFQLLALQGEYLKKMLEMVPVDKDELKDLVATPAGSVPVIHTIQGVLNAIVKALDERDPSNLANDITSITDF